ncbi:MAG TPA: hypothetical protein VN922_12755 [Bacteroidia bacterium]|nr:hypothetical protein [Bacteroidia bacterium]
MNTETKNSCYFCNGDCTGEYYSWSHENLKLDKDGVVQKTKKLIICPSCYNVPLEPHGTFGKNMIRRGEGRIEKHEINKMEVIREK